MGEAKRKARLIRIEPRREGGATWYEAIVSLEQLHAKGTAAQFEEVCTDIARIAAEGAARGDGVRASVCTDLTVPGGRVVKLGPFPVATAAEVSGRQFLHMIAGVLEIPREGFDLHDLGTGMYADSGTQQRSRPPAALRDAPADLAARQERARELEQAAQAMGADQIDLLLAAYRATVARDEHPIAFVQAARAVTQWLEEPDRPLTPLEVLERKRQHIAGVISTELSPGESFALLLMTNGEGGHLSHISSIDRTTLIKILREYLGHLEQMHRGRS